MKKILFVIDSLNSGGAEKSLVSLLSQFDFQKYEVDLLMFSPTGLYLPLIPPKVKILDVPLFLKNQQNGILGLIKNKQFKYLYLRLRISILLRNPLSKKFFHSAQISWKWRSKGLEKITKKYDVAIAYSQGTPTYFVIEKVNAHKKICWVNTDYKHALYNKKYDKSYYDQYDHVIAVSDHNKEIFINEMPNVQEKAIVMYDIISPTLIHSMANEIGGFNDHFDGIRILTIGRLVDAKGYDLAIEACNKLKKKGFKFRWYAIGEGDRRTKLENMVKEYGLEETFIFLGTYSNPYPFLKQSDIYVQPSRFEGYGLAIAEARILQKPIVVTNFTVVHDQIKHNENGLIVNMDADDIFQGLKKIIEDKLLKKKICGNLGKNCIGNEEEIKKLYSLLN